MLWRNSYKIDLDSFPAKWIHILQNKNKDEYPKYLKWLVDAYDVHDVHDVMYKYAYTSKATKFLV